MTDMVTERLPESRLAEIDRELSENIAKSAKELVAKGRTAKYREYVVRVGDLTQKRLKLTSSTHQSDAEAA